MFSILDILFGFILGVMSTFAGLILYAYKKMPASTLKVSSAKAKLNKVKPSGLTLDSKLLAALREITDEQLSIRSQLDLPQKNSLHGKHKNTLVRRMKDLEDKKMDLLRQILASGYDPKITTLDEYGNTETVKLSEYMASMNIDMKQDEEPPKPKTNLRLVKEDSKETSDDNNSDR